MSASPDFSQTAHARARTRELHLQYSGPIFSYCRRRLPSQEEAEDAAQMVFLNAQRSLEKGARPQAEGAWLFKIAEHVVKYRRRTLSRRARVEYPVDLDGVADVVAAPSREVPAEAVGLADALRRLPVQQQRALVLREWQGLSYREIAAELELSASAVETLIFRARRNLAAELEGRAHRLRRRSRTLSLALLVPLKWFAGTGPIGKGAAALASVAALTAAGTQVPALQHISRLPLEVPHVSLTSTPHVVRENVVHHVVAASGTAAHSAHLVARRHESATRFLVPVSRQKHAAPVTVDPGAVASSPEALRQAAPAPAPATTTTTTTTDSIPAPPPAASAPPASDTGAGAAQPPAQQTAPPAAATPAADAGPGKSDTAHARNEARREARH